MKVAILGAGFSGLAAAWQLRKQGISVDVYERNPYPGGLAAGFTETNWNWTLEHHYHHVFSSDTDLQQLLQDMKLADSLAYYNAISMTMLPDLTLAPLDSALSLLRFPQLSWITKLRMALTLAVLKYTSPWRLLESYSAEEFLLATMGNEAYQKIWKPLFVGKFSEHAASVNAAWFWARIKARSKYLGYPTRGFFSLAQAMQTAIEKAGAMVFLGQAVEQVEANKTSVSITTAKGKKSYQAVISTLPSVITAKLIPQIAKELAPSAKLPSLAAQTLVLTLDAKFLDSGCYWLNITDDTWPFLAIVEHTNLIDRKHYGGQHILYIGNYLSTKHADYGKSADELLELYLPYLSRLQASIKSSVIEARVFRADFAQPVPQKNHSQRLPGIKSKDLPIYHASMQQVYPWDRGTNFAVEVGVRVANRVAHDLQK